MILFGDLVGAWRFELQTSCAQGSCKKSILLVRPALFYVMVHGFGPDLAAFGPKLDPSMGTPFFRAHLVHASGRQSHYQFGLVLE